MKSNVIQKIKQYPFE